MTITEQINEKLNEKRKDYMAKFTVTVKPGLNKEHIVTLTIHDDFDVVTSKSLKDNADKTYEKLFEFCKKEIEKIK